MSKKYWEFKNKTSTEADLYLYIEMMLINLLETF